MKLSAQLLAGHRRGKRSAFTLLEMMIATGVYLVLFIGALVAIQIFALRVYTLAATKLTATQASRKALNQIRDDIRQAKMLQVGVTDNSGNFYANGGTNLAVGNGLQVFYTTNAGVPYSIYYLQTNSPGGVSSNCLIWKSVTSSGTTTASLATYITNLDIFAAEDWDSWPATGPATNSLFNNQVYSVKMQFYQWEYPIAVISTNGGANAYDYYQIRTRVCRRALE